MILDFDDACWSYNDDDWCQSLAELLLVVKRREQHAFLAAHAEMLFWCERNLPGFVDYFRTRLASAQPRANGLKITVSPSGAHGVTGPPPWHLDARSTLGIADRPLRVVFENDESDQLFTASTLPAFSTWRAREWIEPAMGGGSTMQAKIESAGNDDIARWRTFFLFDSDRLHPDELAAGWTPPGGDGCQGYVFEVACACMPRCRWHRLQRRSIENYLPGVVLHGLDQQTNFALQGPSVGRMAHYYNMKRGLQGDELKSDGTPNTIRWARTKGFWAALHPADAAALRLGFGRRVAEEFSNVPPNHPWPADVIAEMYALGDAIQDAM